MRLKKKQKGFLLSLVAEGLASDEINDRAATFKPPFEVSRQQVDFYRSSRGVRLDELKEESESEALRTGLALKEGRVEALNDLAERLRAELLAEGPAGRLWLPRQKALGSGASMQVVEEEHFNLVEINALRAVLDDIAKEMGARTYERRDAAAEEDEQPSEVKVTVAYEEKPKQTDEEE
ncbi:MAG: hypothetical protein ABW208_10220 [Pyrinomonadaceae bacterium]